MFPEEHLFTINLHLLLEEKLIQRRKQVVLSLGHVYLSEEAQTHGMLPHHKVESCSDRQAYSPHTPSSEGS